VASSIFTLLDDQPFASSEHDPLGFDQIAGDLAALIRASKASTPLALGVESGWGMGKSTLMRRLQSVLKTDENVETVWFNAWTAEEGTALEGLVKSVLNELDDNFLRRAARNKRLLSWVRVAVLVIADWLKLGSVVDSLWKEVSVDPKARNELQRLVAESMREWAGMRAELGPQRLLVVFVDDLDRCPPGNVLQVFEAIKLYLDAPGLVFVVGYDRDVVSDAILDLKHYSDSVTSHRYLEKIVQLVFRLPSVSDQAANALLDVYLEMSGTANLFDESARSLTIEQNARNPRRIKRFINAFVLEYGLDAEWEEMGPETLVRVLIIDVYFPDFGQLLRSRSERDPVADFRQYVEVRNIVRRGSGTPEEAALVTEAFASRGLATPAPEQRMPNLDREVPPSFPKLAQNGDFLRLLDGIGDVARLRDKLRRFSATTVRRPPSTARIIISYRRSDSAAYAGRLSDRLGEHFGQGRLFLDIASLEPGVDFGQVIESAIANAGVVLAVIGPGWSGPWLAETGDWVKRELELALNRSQVPVIPVLVGGAQMPEMDELPPELRTLTQRQALVLSDDRWNQDVDRLIDSIEYWLSGTSSIERQAA
jgi:KAP family P-loop domain/TIR domain